MSNLTNLNQHKYIISLIGILLCFGITKAQISFAFGEYTGNGSASAITGVGFEPDAVFIKAEAASQAVITTRDMPTGETKGMGVQAAHTTGRITTLDSDGFTLGTDVEVNDDGIVYQWMAFEDGGDLSIGTYSGTGSSVTISAIGWQPEMIWYWGDGNHARDDATMYLKVNTERCDRFRSGARSTDMIGALNSSGFTTGNHGTHGRDRSGAEYYYIAFNEATGVLLDGGFTGNTTDGRAINPSGGWQPDFVVCNAAIDNHRPIMRTASMSGDESLRFSASGIATNQIQSLTSTGFTIGTGALAHDAHNANDYVMMKGGTEQTVTITLPIELIKFDARLEGEQVHITWTTGSEINNDFFQVERSINGIDFEIIETVLGAGNSQEVINYNTYDDLPPSGIVYYRIRQTDFDGENAVFDVKSIYNGTNNHTDWVHATESGKHKLNIFGELEGTFEVVVMDLNGKIVFNKNFLTTSRNKTSMLVTLPPDLKNAVYLVNILHNGFQNSGKILIRDLK